MSEINIMNANCTCSDGGVCDCNIEELHMSCVRNRTEVYATLPETGVVGATYFIGDNSTGYTEYVWNGSEFVSMGTASGSFYRAMSLDELGLGKLSTATTLTNGAVVGMNSANQLMIPVATLNSYGAVKLGSQYVSQYPQPYHVGVTVNNDGKLVFNLRQTQSDGSPGCLKYQRKTTSSPFEMFIEEAGVGQMGIVKILHSLNGYTEEEIESMRETHAASVGLVVDGLDSFCEWFFTDSLMQGYFDTWASGKSLGEEVWTNHQDVLVETVAEAVLSDAAIANTAVVMAQKTATEWLSANITDSYVNELFKPQIDALAKQYWTSDVVSLVESTSREVIEENFQDELKGCLSVPENVSAVAEVVAEKSKSILVESKDEIVVAHVEDVLGGSVPVEIDGVSTTFPEYIRNRIDNFVQEAITGINERIDYALSVATNRAYSTTKLWEGESGALEVMLSGLSNYDKIFVVYKDHGGVTAGVDIDLNVARATSTNLLYTAVGGVNGATIDSKYGANDTTPCIKLNITSGLLSWSYYGPYARGGILKVVGLKGVYVES